MQIQRQSFIQEQRLKMNPQLFQSIKLMALPLLELRDRIEQELESNPALEVLEDRSTLSLDDYKTGEESDDYFESTSDSGFINRGSDETGDEKRQFLEGAIARHETLQEHLLWQWRLQPIAAEDRDLGELLIQNLDASGFHIEDPTTLLAAPDLSQMRRVMAIIQALDPQGTCVQDYHESLLVQARLMPNPPEHIEEVLEKHLDLVEKDKAAELAKKLHSSEAAMRRVIEAIRTLNPFPGRLVDSGETRYVVPDLQVVKKEGEFVIILNEEEIPVLGINPFFMKLSDEKADGKGVRDFVRENIKEARWFIRSVNQRNHTLLKVMRAIVEFQRQFFVRGPKHLAPLTLKDIASEIGVHETTVSRIANAKYVQTEWGIYPIKHFFTNSISGAGSGGSRYSKEGVKEIIREIIEADGVNLSDQNIADLLVKKGIPLARRTVAKYRKELAIGSSYNR